MKLYITDHQNYVYRIARYIALESEITYDAQKNYLVTPNGTVVWCPRKLLLLCAPEDYSQRYKYWKAEELPIVPKTWKMKVNPCYWRQYEILRDLVAEADTVVHAGALTKESQAVIDELLEYCQFQGQVLRMLHGTNLVENRQHQAITQSIKARKYADWMFGVNFSRAYSLISKRRISVGRVKTVALAMVVRREAEIKKNRSADVLVTLSLANGKKCKGRLLLDHSVTLDEARAFIKSFANGEVVQIREVKTVHQIFEEPQLYSMSNLQIAANELYGCSLLLTKTILKKLYEKKCITSPYTESCFIPAAFFTLKRITFSYRGQEFVMESKICQAPGFMSLYLPDDEIAPQFQALDSLWISYKIRQGNPLV